MTLQSPANFAVNRRKETSSATDNYRSPTLFLEGARLSPGQESVLVALDHLDAVPADPQNGWSTSEIASLAGMTDHVTRARLTELRETGFVASGACPHFQGAPLADVETRHAHYLTPDGYQRSRWAITGREQSDKIAGQESRLLAWLYCAAAVPSDRLIQERHALATMGTFYREKTNQQISNIELARYIIRQRKQGHWPRLGSSALRSEFESSAEPLSKRERRTLFNVYPDQGRSCDAIMGSVWHGRSLARAFEETTGVRQPVRLLIDTLLSARKAGDLPHLRPDPVGPA